MEHKVKVTTQSAFTENEITDWLDKVSSLGWDLVTATFFGSGMMWIFRREAGGAWGENAEDLDEIPNA